MRNIFQAPTQIHAMYADYPVEAIFWDFYFILAQVSSLLCLCVLLSDPCLITFDAVTRLLHAIEA